MRLGQLAHPADFEGWRSAARAFLAADVAPGDVLWRVGEGDDLFSNASAPAAPTPSPASQPSAPFHVPRDFLELARLVACHADEGRFALLYRLLWRLRADRRLLERSTDADVFRANAMAKTIRRERHKMEAFVRFREIADADGALFVAWFEPEHHVVELTAPFFMRRFASMRWSILTPRVSAHWDTRDLRFGPGASKDDAPSDDRFEAHWLTYYANIFNPARLKVGMMKSEMPVRYWKNLPESVLIGPLVRAACRREAEMIEAAPAPTPRRAQIILDRLKANAEAAPAAVPADALAALAREAAGCRLCPLWSAATATVFGEGPADARIVFVGEQPGDQEDLAGRPFVGPAGQVFDRALAEAGLDRARVYVTNAVKHFKHEPRGKRRLHKTPDVSETAACRGWLARELAAIRPRVAVALGATALRSLTGRTDAISSLRGTFVPSDLVDEAFVTTHPSAILRAPEATRERAYRAFVEDLKTLARRMG